VTPPRYSSAPLRLLALALAAVSVVAATLREPVPRGWLGVTLGDPGSPGARIDQVLPESPARSAGLVAGEVIRRAGTRAIHRPRDLIETIGHTPPGTIVTLDVERGGARVNVAVTIGARPPDVYRFFEADRDSWQEPARVLALLAVGAGGRVADVGAGGGYFTERLAALVGPTGRVIAVEIDPDALRELSRRFAATPTVVVQRGRILDPNLGSGSLDAALLVDTFHELREPESILAALRRAVRPGGRLVVVDRPATEYAREAHAIPETRVVTEGEAAGFHVRERTDLPRQFAVVFE